MAGSFGMVGEKIMGADRIVKDLTLTGSERDLSEVTGWPNREIVL
jgi:hypothetical protein